MPCSFILPGLKRGDTVITINGQSVRDHSLEEAIDILKGDLQDQDKEIVFERKVWRPQGHSVDNTSTEAIVDRIGRDQVANSSHPLSGRVTRKPKTTGRPPAFGRQVDHNRRHQQQQQRQQQQKGERKYSQGGRSSDRLDGVASHHSEVPATAGAQRTEARSKPSRDAETEEELLKAPPFVKSAEEAAVDSVYQRIGALLRKKHTHRDSSELSQEEKNPYSGAQSENRQHHSVGGGGNASMPNKRRTSDAMHQHPESDDETIDTAEHELNAIEELVSKRHILH